MLFDKVRRVVESVGPVRVLPEKSRIAFQVRMSFAQITVRRNWLDGHVVLARRLNEERFRDIQTISARNHVHTFRIQDGEDIDDRFRSWIEEAYQVGAQKHLER